MQIQHLSAKLPSPLLKMVDLNSRNPVDCNTDSCRICQEVRGADTVFAGRASSELASKVAWRDIQQTCKDLRRTCSLLASGKHLASNKKRASDLRCYLCQCRINSKRLLVVHRTAQFQPSPLEAIVIPRDFAYNAARALHIQWGHPTRAQMKQKFRHQYFILDEGKILDKVYLSCEYPCQAAKQIPKEVLQFSTDTKPNRIASHLVPMWWKKANKRFWYCRKHLHPSQPQCSSQTRQRQRYEGP